MKIKQTTKNLLLGALLMVGLTVAAVAAASVTFAASDVAAQNECGGVKTAIIDCEQNGGSAAEDTGIWGILLLAINILTAGIAIVAIGGIIYGGILYTSAGGSQEQVKKAMDIIRNVVIGIIAYALMYSGLNFLIPGGLFV